MLLFISAPSGDEIENCGVVDDLFIPEYQWLCSGDSRVLCGTNNAISVYEITDEAETGMQEAGAVVSPTTSGYTLSHCHEKHLNEGTEKSLLFRGLRSAAMATSVKSWCGARPLDSQPDDDVLHIHLIRSTPFVSKRVPFGTG